MTDNVPQGGKGEQGGYRLTAAALSFLLPGLGQLYRREWIRSVLFFFVFIAFLCDPRVQEGHWGTLLVLALASFDAVKARPFRVGPKNRVRTFCFVSLGLLAFVFWIQLDMVPLAPHLTTQMDVNDSAGRLAAKVEHCRNRKGHLPQTLAECLTAQQLKRAVDPWGTPFSYELSRGGFTLRSDGPDKIAHTDDDFLYHYQ